MARGCVALVLGVCIQLPMWLFLTYSLLAASNVDRLVWVVFWAYVPVTTLSFILSAIAGIIDD